jgi:hypothetical protein
MKKTTETVSKQKLQITSDVAATLLASDVANIRQKVEGGKTLSTSERAVLQTVSEGGSLANAKAWANDQVELADILGIDRKSVQRWRKLGAPDAESNGRWNVAAWKAWMKANGKHGVDGDDTPEKQQLEAKWLLLRNEKLEVEIGVLRGDYVKVVEVEAFIRSMVTEARKVFEQGRLTLPPALVGLSAVEIQNRITAWIDDGCLKLHTGKN